MADNLNSKLTKDIVLEVGNVENDEKPTVDLVGKDGNVFSVIGEIYNVLRQEGMKDKAEEFSRESLQSDDYNSVLKLALKYVKINRILDQEIDDDNEDGD